MEEYFLFFLNKISQSIFDKKGSNILALDLRPCSALSQYVIIAEGSVDKHVIAIAGAVRRSMEEAGWGTSFIQGIQTGDWIVLDYNLISVHLFVPKVRERYQLERLWQKSEIVDVVIDVTENNCLNI